MFPDQCFGRPDLAVAQVVILRQFDRRLSPELRFAVGVMHVDVEAGFLAGKEEEAKAVLAEDGWAQGMRFGELTCCSVAGQDDG